MNFQAAVSYFFKWQTSWVARWPLPFLVLPLLFTIFIVTLTATDFQLNISNHTLEVFLPDEMPALTDLKKLLELFPPRDALRDSYSIFGSTFAYVILEDVSERANALEPLGILRLAELHRNITRIRVSKDPLDTTGSSKHFTFSDLCMKGPPVGGCAMHPLAFALEDSDPVLSAQFLLRYPQLKLANLSIDNAVVFGGVMVKESGRDSSGNAPIISAKAVRLVYVLQSTEPAERWVDAFLAESANFKAPNTTFFISSSHSLGKEMERNGELLIPWMPWMSLVLVLFCMSICSSLDPVKSQPWIGVGAMFSAVLATISATSLLIYFRYPFLHIVLIMPFLVISVGTDNMFLMLKSWRLLEGDFICPEKRFIAAITETSASLFLTSLTDGLSFSIGSWCTFHAVRVFCTYCAMAILFMFLYQVTFFNALMVLNCRREASNRHALFCYKVKRKPIVPLPWSSSVRGMEADGSRSGLILARLLRPWFSRFFVFLLYIAYLTASINWALLLPLATDKSSNPGRQLNGAFKRIITGLDLKLLTPDGSYVAEELRAQERLFSDYGAFCFGVVQTTNVSLSEPAVRTKLLQLYNNLSSGKFASAHEFWLEDFERENAGKKFANAERFTLNLVQFLSRPDTSKYRSDVRFTLEGQVEAVKMILRVRKLGPENDQPRADFLRETFRGSQFDGFVYDTSFLLVDQQSETLSNVIWNVITATFSMLAICAFLIPRPASSLCIAVAIVSVNVGVVAALSALGTRLDIISMITIVMSVGFSVDYVTHTTFHYVVQRYDRIERCLAVVTEPILQSAFSTAVGVSLLAVVPSYIVRTFVFTVLAVVAIGVVHGLLFLPVLLDVAVPRSEFMEAYSPAEEERAATVQRWAANVTHDITKIQSKRMQCYLTTAWEEDSNCSSEFYSIPPFVNLPKSPEQVKSEH